MLLTLISLIPGCGRQSASSTVTPAPPQGKPQSLPDMGMFIGKQKFLIEVAVSEEQQGIGLMYRDSMPSDHGMIFVFPDEEPREFWMKNTRIPLDILYLDREGRVVSIKQMKPFDLTGVPSDYPAMYAIELNEGGAAAAGVKVGDIVKVPPLPDAATKPMDR
jgi:uncharacterized membrane protein (UPF0127 family)